MVHCREYIQNWSYILPSSDSFGNYPDEWVVERNSFCGSPNRNLNWYKSTFYQSQRGGLYCSEFQF